MLRYLYYTSRYAPYLTNNHGIKKFAERCMGQLIRKVTKRSAFYREMNENLMVEKANLRLRSSELQKQRMLDAGAFFSVRRRLLADAVLVGVLVVASVFLGLVAIAALFEEAAALPGFLHGVAALFLAAVLTGGGLVVTERLVELLFQEAPAGEKRSRQRGPAAIALWALLLAGIELAILGVSDVQAARLAGHTGSVLLHYGLVLLSMLLPVIAGALRWDALCHLNAYKVTQSLREIESRLAQIDSILRQNEEYESNFYKLKSISYWDQVNGFKTYKGNLNEKQGITESLKGHFAQSYDAFQAEAGKRYEADLRDFMSRSMRTLKQADRPAGQKIGQGQNGHSSSPASEEQKKHIPALSGNGSGHAEEYLELKPVR